MGKQLTKEECQKKLFQLGIKLGVSPKLISTRLLSNDDKHDMLNGLVTDEALLCHVKCWMQAGMPNYAEGKTEPHRPPEELPMSRYRGIGKVPENRKFSR